MNPDTLRFLDALFTGTHEVRILGTSRHGAWFRDAAEASQALAGFDTSTARGVYVTLNPSALDTDPTFTRLGKGDATSDEDITRRRVLLIDIDPTRAPGCKTLCATDAEKLEAQRLALEVQDYLASQGWSDPVTTDSGNGVSLFYRIDLPADSELPRDVLRALAARFDNDGATIDVTVANASRIARIPGTWNRKGENSDARPHRLASLTSLPSPWDACTEEALRRVLPVAPSPSVEVAPPRAASVETTPPDDAELSFPPMQERATRCRRYVAAMPPAIQGERGSDATYRVASIIRNDFALDSQHGYPILVEYSQRCVPPWSPSELHHKWESAGGTDPMHPRGCKLTREREAFNDPYRLAKTFAAKTKWIYYRQAYYCYAGTYYDRVTSDGLRVELARHVKDEFDAWHDEACKAYRKAWDGVSAYKEPACPQVTRNVVANAVNAFDSMTYFRDGNEAPCLHPSGERRNWLAFRNGIFDLDARELLPHTDAWFSVVCLPYDYSPRARCPTWEGVVARILPDAEERDFLQQWFGYCLAGDVEAQVAAILVGEGSNGKSVALTVLRNMLGAPNVSSVQLDELGSRFGPVATLGKLANIVPEMAYLDRVDEGRLKAFISQDRMQFEQKYKDTFTARPTAKLIVATNELPRINDRSAGFFRRLRILEFGVKIAEADADRRFTTDRFWVAELPGVFNWALAGLDKLAARGWLLPETLGMRAAKEAHRRESNPALDFLERHYLADAEGHACKDDVYQQYTRWLHDRGYRAELGEARFGKEVKRVFGLTATQLDGKRTINGKRVRVYLGIRERRDDEEPTVATVPRRDEAGTMCPDRPRDAVSGGPETDRIAEILSRFLDATPFAGGTTP